jgi:hypothetical protein
MELELTEYERRTFTVTAVEVTYKNIEQLAAWCKGKLDVESSRVLGGAGEVDLPVIKLAGQGEDKGKELLARLGYFIVQSKNRFRVYKAPQFHAAFQKKLELEQVAGQKYDPKIDDEYHEEGVSEEDFTEYKAPEHDNSSVDGQETVHVHL